MAVLNEGYKNEKAAHLYGKVLSEVYFSHKGRFVLQVQTYLLTVRR
jgi:hypothetical protein